MVPHTPVWKWILGFGFLVVSLAIAIPLGRYAEADDAPGGVVIAFLILFVGAAGAIWIVNPRQR